MCVCVCFKGTFFGTFSPVSVSVTDIDVSCNGWLSFFWTVDVAALTSYFPVIEPVKYLSIIVADFL